MGPEAPPRRISRSRVPRGRSSCAGFFIPISSTYTWQYVEGQGLGCRYASSKIASLFFGGCLWIPPRCSLFLSLDFRLLRSSDEPCGNHWARTDAPITLLHHV